MDTHPIEHPPNVVVRDNVDPRPRLPNFVDVGEDVDGLVESSRESSEDQSFVLCLNDKINQLG